MSLASVIKQKERSQTSNKGPQYYNAEKNAFIADMVSDENTIVRLVAVSNEKNAFIADMVSDENTIVRLVAVSNEHIPTKVLQARLEIEQEKDVIRAILMNRNLPKKALLTFATKDSRAKMFDDDEQLIEYVDSLDLEQ